MVVRKPDDEGFGLVELIIAFFLLAVIAVAILPALVNGIRYSSEQSSAATATRQLNKVVEVARALDNPTCTDVSTAIASPTLTSFRDGRGRTLTVTEAVTCSTGQARLDLSVLDGTKTLTSVTALVYTK